MYNSFFIRSSVDGHLGCSHGLAVVRSAAVNTGVRVSFAITVSEGISPVVRLLGYMIVLFLTF